MSNSQHLVRSSDVSAYPPENHHGTMNRRLIGRETVGAENFEVVLGVAQKRGGALPHAHPGIEQVCYLIRGAARVEVGGDAFEMDPATAASPLPKWNTCLSPRAMNRPTF